MWFHKGHRRFEGESQHRPAGQCQTERPSQPRSEKRLPFSRSRTSTRRGRFAWSAKERDFGRSGFAKPTKIWEERYMETKKSTRHRFLRKNAALKRTQRWDSEDRMPIIATAPSEWDNSTLGEDAPSSTEPETESESGKLVDEDGSHPGTKDGIQSLATRSRLHDNA
ncbi:hypothetical protein B0T16DRAFT_454912 [Cercophora newfieldiana]|uniref:Uncharacterized protein n=1 Tax=Cercophora newfieldiana TaxID=92897 RepID=A0AA40CX90_9PEZI|nr:hypothetical protein B0T16DRAFT_454912 [Cercophora newfieldiana]